MRYAATSGNVEFGDAMIKVVVLLARLPQLSHDAFVEYYETRHARLVQQLLPMISEYRRNHVVGTAYTLGEPAPMPWDTVTEMRFDTQSAYDAFCRAVTDPDVLTPLRADEGNFLDNTKTLRFVVEERTSPAASA